MPMEVKPELGGCFSSWAHLVISGGGVENLL